MNKKHCALFALLFFSSVSFAQQNPADVHLLPEQFPVYYDKDTHMVINHNVPNTKPGALPTINAYKGAPGCYMACYSHNQENSIYPVSNTVFVMGQIRVPGHYEARICKPDQFKGSTGNQELELKKMCSEHLSEQCRDLSCWAGGDTGGWFGIR